MRWGLIGASNIAASHMIGAMRNTGGEVVSVLSSSPTAPSSYAAEHGIANGFSDLDALLQG
jgi:1,5-anhydro-D-fructose reductase (1,5-anhydro-D-mannitol-forming)